PMPGAGTYTSGKNQGRPVMAWIATGTPAEQERKRAKALEAEPLSLDVIVSTAHKAKGLEWDRVRIGDDFKGPKQDTETGELVMPDPEELRLAYVAVTRARRELDPGALAYVFEHTNPNGEAAPAVERETPTSPRE